MTAMRRPVVDKSFINVLKDKTDIALCSHVFERAENSFSVSDIQQEMQDRGVYLDSIDLRERLRHFVQLGFLEEEYKLFVRRPVTD